MASRGTVVAEICEARSPVLFLDTCILLDIIRSTDRCLSDHAERASDLLTRVADRRCRIVLPSIVRREWDSNVRGVIGEVDRGLAKMEEKSSHFHDACRILGIDAGFAPGRYSSLGLSGRLRDLSERLLNSATHLDADDDCKVRAVNRVVDDLPPSRRGGEVKDCTILEEILAVCRGLEAANFEGKRIFCTSNTSDYCDGAKHLHAKLAVEFKDLNLIFAANIATAFQLLVR